MEALKLNELMSLHFPEQEYVVDRLIPDASLAILSGESRSFKTYTLLDMALAVAKGEPFLDEFKTKQTGVLIIDEENGHRLLQKRLHQLGASVEDLPIHISSLGGFLLESNHIHELKTFCKENGIGFVIIDALIRVHNADENSAREMSKVFSQLRKLTEVGLAVLVTHHNRKSGPNSTNGANEMRGSGDVLAAVDTHIAVVRKDQWYLTFNQTKQRYDVELDPFEVRVVIDSDQMFTFEYLGTKKSGVSQADFIRSSILSTLVSKSPISQKDLLDALKTQGVRTNEHPVRELLAHMISEGLIPAPSKGNGNTKLYTVFENEETTPSKDSSFLGGDTDD